MRTQYSRTAFQLPDSAAVRISLDTNLTMMCERDVDDDKSLASGDAVEDEAGGAGASAAAAPRGPSERWYRDPALPVPRGQITRFPHAVLEIKIESSESEGAGAEPPAWVTEVLDAGCAHEVHKFSKFVHGCAVLLTDDVRAAHRWALSATPGATDVEKRDLLSLTFGRRVSRLEFRRVRARWFAKRTRRDPPDACLPRAPLSAACVPVTLSWREAAAVQP